MTHRWLLINESITNVTNLVASFVILVTDSLIGNPEIKK